MLTVIPERLENPRDGRSEHLSHGHKAPCIQVRRLLSGLPDRRRRLRWLMIVDVIHQLVIDESGYGSNEPNDAFVFAGYLAPVDSWEDFAHLIDPIFNGPPALTAHYFKKLVRSKQQDDPRILDTVQAIRKAGLRDVRFKIPNSDYCRWLEIMTTRKGTSAPLELKGNCWFFAFVILITELLTNYVAMDPLGKLEVIYDFNHSERERAGFFAYRFAHADGSHPRTLAR